jgi:hypothetical protein
MRAETGSRPAHVTPRIRHRPRFRSTAIGVSGVIELGEGLVSTRPAGGGSGASNPRRISSVAPIRRRKPARSSFLIPGFY